MSFLTTIQKLKTVLDLISSSILPVKYQYLEAQPSSFPAGIITFVGAEERMLDTVTNEVTEQFLIRTIFPAEESQTATEKWLNLLDALGDEFRKDDHQTLTGTAHSFMITKFLPSFSDQYAQPVAVFDIFVEAKFLKQINL